MSERGAEGALAVGTSRRTRRGDETRARILAAARQSFLATGWHRARVEDVCRAANIGHGTFYAYYANKLDVLEALVRHHAASLYLIVEAPWTSGDVCADVRAVIDGFVRRAEEDHDIRTVWAMAAPSEPRLAGLVEEVRAQFVARVRDNIAAAVAAGTARRGIDVEVAATALTAMVEQTVALIATQVERRRMVEALADIWVAAVYR